MTYTGSRLVPPPSDEEEYPFRSVWRSIVIENGIFTAIVLGLYVLVGIFGFTVPASVHMPLLITVVILPVGLWLIYSFWAERGATQPRYGLIQVLILSGLVANAVGIPLVEDGIQIERWISLEPALNRILGYAITVGVVRETLKYLVAYYTIWPHQLRTRLDSLAYAVPIALGYATVENIRYVMQDTPPLEAALLRVFSTVVIHLVASSIVAYGLSALFFESPSPIFMPIVLLISAFVVGLAIPVRAGLVNTTFSLDVSAPRGLLGLVFSITLLSVPHLIIAFLIQNAEQRERESLIGRRAP